MLGRGKGRKAGAGVAVLALVTIGTAGAGVPAHAASGGTTVAPYVDMAGPNPSALDDAITKDGLTDFTAAFVIAKGCTPTWDDGTKVATNAAFADRIQTARDEGAEPIVSFGGQAGKDLARTCTDQAKVTAGYQAVIHQFGVNRVDFDVEGKALKDTAGLARRFVAIHALEAANPGLVVSATLPVGPSGLLETGVQFLHRAHDADVRLDLVNIMAMDYGDARDMGAAAISAARGARTQLDAVWPADTYANLGVTPMIGVNDTAVEVFSMKNANTLVRFARQNGLGRLGFWSIDRDQKCKPPKQKARADCSGVAQKPGAFAETFASAG
ncbi:MAG TPA: chitinase [Acidimicrobiia bacterium]|nr:chitinase [Acidimicrobiia bacterium]